MMIKAWWWAAGFSFGTLVQFLLLAYGHPLSRPALMASAAALLVLLVLVKALEARI